MSETVTEEIVHKALEYIREAYPNIAPISKNMANIYYLQMRHYTVDELREVARTIASKCDRYPTAKQMVDACESLARVRRQGEERAKREADEGEFTPEAMQENRARAHAMVTKLVEMNLAGDAPRWRWMPPNHIAKKLCIEEAKLNGIDPPLFWLQEHRNEALGTPWPKYNPKAATPQDDIDAF